MALIYHSNIRSVFAERAIRLGFSDPSITIYAGEQPLAAAIISSWSSYNNTSNNLLWHATGGPNELQFALQNNVTVYANSFPALTAPVRAGTASWAIVWSTAVAYSSMGTGTIPNTMFMVVPVTAQNGDGVCKLQSTSLTTGTSITITNFSMTSNI